MTTIEELYESRDPINIQMADELVKGSILNMLFEINDSYLGDLIINDGFNFQSSFMYDLYTITITNLVSLNSSSPRNNSLFINWYTVTIRMSSIKKVLNLKDQFIYFKYNPEKLKEWFIKQIDVMLYG